MIDVEIRYVQGYANLLGTSAEGIKLVDAFLPPDTGSEIQVIDAGQILIDLGSLWDFKQLATERGLTWTEAL